MTRRHLWLYPVALLGSFNLALGVALALREPTRAGDLWRVYDWCHEWLYNGAQLYGSNASPDYPPNAIVTFAPLATLPPSWIVLVWTVTTLVLTPLLPLAVLRAASQRSPVSAPGIPAAGILPASFHPAGIHPAIVTTLLFVCWGGARTLLQFSQLSLLLALVALSMPAHWILGGTCLALALAKPHIAGPIALWMACTRRIGAMLVAAAVLAIELGMYCLRSGATPLQTLTGWVGALRETYLGPEALNGYTSLRPWMTSAIEDHMWADAAWISISLIVLLVLCRAAVRDRTETLAIPALLCLWSLLTIYHNLNNLILMLPGFVFLLTVEDPATRTWRLWAIGLIQTALMLDVPVRFRDVVGGPVGKMMLDADRLLVLGTFMVVGWCWLRLQRARSAADQARRNHCGAPRTMRNAYASGSAAAGHRG